MEDNDIQAADLKRSDAGDCCACSATEDIISDQERYVKTLNNNRIIDEKILWGRMGRMEIGRNEVENEQIRTNTSLEGCHPACVKIGRNEDSMDEVDGVFASTRTACRIFAKNIPGHQEWRPGGYYVLLSNSDTSGMCYWEITGTKDGSKYFAFAHKDSGKLKFATAENRGIIFDEGDHPSELEELSEDQLLHHKHLFGLKGSRKTGNQGILFPIGNERMAITIVDGKLKLVMSSTDVTEWKIKKI